MQLKTFWHKPNFLGEILSHYDLDNLTIGNSEPAENFQICRDYVCTFSSLYQIIICILLLLISPRVFVRGIWWYQNSSKYIYFYIILLRSIYVNSTRKETRTDQKTFHNDMKACLSGYWRWQNEPFPCKPDLCSYLRSLEVYIHNSFFLKVKFLRRGLTMR